MRGFLLLCVLGLPAPLLFGQAQVGPTIFQGQLTANAGIVNLTTTTAAATYTVPVGVRYVELTSSTAQAITLPTFTTAQAGIVVGVIFKGLAADSIVAPSGAIYINGASYAATLAVPLRFAGLIDLVWDGTNYYNVQPAPDFATVTPTTSTGLGTVSVAAAMGTGSTSSAGSITFTTTTAGTAGGTILTLTFSKTLAAPYIACAFDATTTVGATNKTLYHIGAFTTTTVTLVDGTTAMPAGAYGLVYQCQ